MEIQGTVTKWEFRNPHPILYVEVTDEHGKNTWLLQFHNVTTMTRRGVTAQTFPPGIVIKAIGAPSRVPAGTSDCCVAWKASAVAWRMSPAPRRVKSVAGGRDVEADGCGHDEDGGAEFCD